MSGNGHFWVSTKDGPAPDTRKPNTVGFDWTLARVDEFWAALYEVVGVMDTRDMILCAQKCTRWTRAAWENVSCVTSEGNRVLTVPDENMTDKSLVANEVRGQELGPIIQYVAERGEKGKAGSVGVNTVDADKTNVRTAVIKTKIDSINLIGIATNAESKHKAETEENKTLGVVSHIMVPGTAAYTRKRKADGTINGFEADPHSTRQSPLSDKEMVGWTLMFPHVFGGIIGLLNRTGALPMEISSGVRAFYDWIHSMLKEHFGGLMDATVYESYSRMKEGYKTRALMLSIWKIIIMHLGDLQDERRDLKNLLLCLHVNALPMQMVSVAAHCFLTRALHMGSLLVTAVMAQHLDVPVLDWAALKRFFNEDAAPTTEADMEVMARIKEMFTRFIQGGQLCPEEAGTFSREANISCYITSPGTAEHTPSMGRRGIMRIQDPKITMDNEDETLAKISQLFKTAYGDILWRSACLGPETASIKYAIHDTIKNFHPDFRRLIGPKLYHSRRHLVKLGLLQYAPGMKDFDEIEPPQYVKVYRFAVGNEIRSAGIGVNIWDLLCLASLEAVKIHAHISSIVGRSILEKVLEQTPAGFTPSNIQPLRSFNPDTVMHENLVVSKEARPKHLLRPECRAFGSNGVLPVCKLIKGTPLVPEDIPHVPFLPDLAAMLHCKLMEVPSDVVQVLSPPGFGYEWCLTRLTAGRVRGASKHALRCAQASRGGEGHCVWHALHHVELGDVGDTRRRRFGDRILPRDHDVAQAAQGAGPGPRPHDLARRGVCGRGVSGSEGCGMPPRVPQHQQPVQP